MGQHSSSEKGGNGNNSRSRLLRRSIGPSSTVTHTQQQQQQPTSKRSVSNASTNNSSTSPPVSSSAPSGLSPLTRSTSVLRRISFGRLEKQNQNSGGSSSSGSPLKILILGTEDSGKSSWFRAIKVASGMTWSMDELDMFRNVIYANILQIYYKAIKQCRKQQMIAPADEEKCQRIEKVCEGEMALHLRAALYYDKNVSDIVRHLIQNEEFRNVLLENAAQTEGVTKFLSEKELKRLSPPDYVPSEQDILQAYRPTGGVDISKLKLDGINAKIYDLSGHKSEQQRWHHSCDNVDVLYYLASLTDYNKTSVQTPTSGSEQSSGENLLKQSLEIFENTLRQIGFNKKTVFILILNKKDVITEKFDAARLKEEFESYSGSKIPKAGIDFIMRLYKERFEKARGGNTKKQLHIFTTSAVNVDEVRETFEQTKQLIATEKLGKKLETHGLI